jgi:hypothetical protein
MKTNELTGDALDWAVAKAEGRKETDLGWWWYSYTPSNNWSQGGPIIERMYREGLRLKLNEYPRGEESKFVASITTPNEFYFGPTPLIAAMRCYVASKLGNEVEIQKELP